MLITNETSTVANNATAYLSSLNKKLTDKKPKKYVKIENTYVNIKQIKTKLQILFIK